MRFQHFNQDFPSEWILRLQCAGVDQTVSQVRQVDGRVSAPIEDKVVEVPAFDSMFPGSAQNRVEFSSEQRGLVVECYEVRLRIELNFSHKSSTIGWRCIDFHFDLEAITSSDGAGNGFSVDGKHGRSGVAFDKSRLDIASDGFFLEVCLELHPEVMQDRLDGIRVILELEIRFCMLQGEVHVFGESVQIVEDAQGGTAIEGCMREEVGLA